MSDSDKRSDIKYEKCVCCKKETIVPVNMNIEYRAFYVEGAGQLCRECYKKLLE